MKRTLSILLAVCLLLSCVGLFAGCSAKGDNQNYPVTVREVTIEQEPKAVVVLNDYLADIVSYIGYDIKMVGRSEECDQEFLQIVPVVGKAAAPDINTITSAGADLVIADNSLTADAKQNLEAAGIKVLQMQPATKLDELQALYVDLGTALGGKTTGAEKGQKSYDTLFDTLDTLNTATTSFVQSAAYLYLDESGQLCTFTEGSLEQKFFNYSGTTNVFAHQTEPVIDPDHLKIESPSYLFVDSTAVLEIMQADPSLANVSALKSGHTLVIPKKNFERHGTSVEQAVFDILSYIEKVSKATPDEATLAATEAATEEATEAATEEETTEEVAQEAETVAEETTADAVY